MVKKNPKIVFLFSLLLALSACSDIKPTYQRKNIEESINKICRSEYGLDVSVEEVEDTIWIYSPFEKLVNENGEPSEKATEEIGNIILSLQRVLLSIDNPPKFYVFVASDTERIGADLVMVGFVPDIVKLQLLFISRDEFFARRFISFTRDPKALKDKYGFHIEKFNMDLPTFIALLTQQKIASSFSKKESKDYFQIDKCVVSYDQRTKDFIIQIDIKNKNYKPGLPDPFQEALKTIYYYTSKVYDFNDFSFVRIVDFESKKIKTFNRKALEDEI